MGSDRPAGGQANGENDADNHADNHGHETPEAARLAATAGRMFLRVEMYAYVVLGVLLSLAALIGVASTGVSLWHAAVEYGSADTLVLTIDRLLFVLMLVEILHTVRVSFRSGTLVCEPFLIVGLIASIRRVLVITLESSQASQPGKWSPEIQAQFNATMVELAVLAVLILVMVASIYVLRLSRSLPAEE